MTAAKKSQSAAAKVVAEVQKPQVQKVGTGTAGGQLALGAIDAGAPPTPRPAKEGEGMTVNQLVEQSGSDQRSIKKWLKLDSIVPLRKERLGQHDSDIYDRKQAFECIARHQRAKSGKGAEVDPETNLTWFQAKLREDVIKLRRENETEQGLADSTLMKTETHHLILRIMANALEQLPGKAKSELGLTAPQTTRLRKMLDETRSAAAAEVQALPI